MKLTGDGLRQLTTGSRSAYPSYSSDGTQILYSRRGVGGGARQMDPDGSNDVPVWTCDFARWAGLSRIVGLTVDGLQIIDLSTRNVETILARESPEWLDIRSIDVSIEANAVALTGLRLGEVDRYNLWRISLDGTGLAKLTTKGGEFPSWLHDGSKIIFANNADGQIWIIDSDGTNPVRLIEP